METMSFFVWSLMVVLSAVVIFVLMYFAAILLKYFGIKISRQSAEKNYETTEKVIVKTEYFSEHDGWHVVFNRGFGTCYGILANISKGQARAGVEVEASILSEPNGTCGFYELIVE